MANQNKEVGRYLAEVALAETVVGNDFATHSHEKSLAKAAWQIARQLAGLRDQLDEVMIMAARHL